MSTTASGADTSTVATRLAKMADLDAVADLFDQYRQFYQQAPDLPRARSFMQQRLTQGDAVVLLAHSPSGAALGFCQMYPSFCSILAQPVYLLYDLYVAPSARRSGTGAALLQAARHHAVSQGYARLDLTTAKTNLSAQALYERLGWVRDDVYLAYTWDV